MKTELDHKDTGVFSTAAVHCQLCTTSKIWRPSPHQSHEEKMRPLGEFPYTGVSGLSFLQWFDTTGKCQEGICNVPLSP